MSTIISGAPQPPFFFAGGPAGGFFNWNVLNRTVKQAHNTGLFDNYLQVLKGERFTFEHPLFLTYSVLAYALYHSDWWMSLAAVFIYGAPQLGQSFWWRAGSVTPISHITMLLAGHLVANEFLKKGKGKRAWWPALATLAGLLTSWVIATYKLWDPYPEREGVGWQGFRDTISIILIHGFMITVAFRLARPVAAIAWYVIAAMAVNKYVGVPLFGPHRPDPNANPTLFGMSKLFYQNVTMIGAVIYGVSGGLSLPLLATIGVITAYVWLS
jgi:hypothetical protein